MPFFFLSVAPYASNAPFFRMKGKFISRQAKSKFFQTNGLSHSETLPTFTAFKPRARGSKDKKKKKKRAFSKVIPVGIWTIPRLLDNKHERPRPWYFTSFNGYEIYHEAWAFAY